MIVTDSHANGLREDRLPIRLAEGDHEETASLGVSGRQRQGERWMTNENA